MLKSVSVLGLKYKVTHKIPERYKDLPNEMVAYGLCETEKRTLWINKELDTETQWRTFWHELFHAVLNRNGVAFAHVLDPAIEEIIVETLANVVYETIESNKDKLHK